MSSPATVPIVDPQGVARDVPYDQMKDALAHGGTLGVAMTFKGDDDGVKRIVPSNKVQEAYQHGGTVVPFAEQATQHAGFWKSVGSDIWGMVKSAPGTIANAALNESTGGTSEMIPDELRAKVGLPPTMASQIKHISEHYEQEKAAGYSAPYRVLAPLAEAVGTNVEGMEQAAREGDVAGVAGHAAAATAPVVAGEGLKSAAPAISDAASAAAEKMSAAAKKVTPKNIARVAGGVNPLAWNAENLGHVAETLLGKERANAPIFQKATSLNDAANSVAEVIAKDRAAQQSEALGKIPAANPDVSAEQAAALGKIAVTDADRAAAQSLVKDALNQHTADIVDKHIPGDTEQTAQTKGAVEYYLRRADVEGAERALDKGAKAANSSWQPLERKPVPSTNEIRERVKADATALQPGSAADSAEDRAIQQEMNWDLQRHGWAAESEARREFIARNSTGMTKGELAKRFAGSRSGSAAETSAAVQATTADDLTSILEKSLDAVRSRKKNAQQ